MNGVPYHHSQHYEVDTQSMCSVEKFHGDDDSHGNDVEQWSTMCPKITCASTRETKRGLSTRQNQPSDAKVLMCSSVRLTKHLPHTSHPDHGKKTTERAFMCGVIPCRKAMIDQDHTFDCCVSTTCSPKGQFQPSAMKTERVCPDVCRSRHPADDVHELKCRQSCDFSASLCLFTPSPPVSDCS